MRVKALFIAIAAGLFWLVAASANAAPAPVPLVSAGQPVDWWFAYKFNAASFPTQALDPDKACAFGGRGMAYPSESLAYAVADAKHSSLRQGPGLLGTGQDDPLGATFGEIFSGDYNYVVYNDQFYGDPEIADGTCRGDSCDAPWAHAKGVIAWNDQGDGLILQVTTPSWPHSGGQAYPAAHGNSLGCVERPNNIMYAQHFFALRAAEPDLKVVLHALANAGILTFPGVDQVVHLTPGGPPDLAAIARGLGNDKPADPQLIHQTLSTGVQVISKPASLHVPVWQLVSAALGGEDLRVASWWSRRDGIWSFGPGAPPCWDSNLGVPGRVEIAKSGAWLGKSFGLEQGSSHAKIAVSLPGGHRYTIFGDMNQSGTFSGDCHNARGQTARGGLFFVVSDPQLFMSVSQLLAGSTEGEWPQVRTSRGAHPLARTHKASHHSQTTRRARRHRPAAMHGA